MKQIVNQKFRKHPVGYDLCIIFKFSFCKVALLILFLGLKVGMKAKQKNLVNSMHRGANGILSYEMVSL